MKAISLTQPWATLVAIGAKRIETRSWRTSYRGPLAIHAAKTFPKWAREAAADPSFAKELTGFNLPLGAVVATCRLVACLSTAAIQGDSILMVDLDSEEICIDDRERKFGDYTPGRWAWVLADVNQFAIPSPAKGALGLWEWEDGA